MSDREPWELTDEEAEQAVKHRLIAKATPEFTEATIYRAIATAAQKRLVEYVLKWGRWEDSWHFILTKDKVDILKAALEVE